LRRWAIINSYIHATFLKHKKSCNIHRDIFENLICMLYQLPNGKVVQLTVEEYLSLTEKDIQYLLSVNAGDYMVSPWSGSIIHKKDTQCTDDEEEIEEPEEQECFFDDYFPDEDDIPDEPFEFELDR